MDRIERSEIEKMSALEGRSFAGRVGPLEYRLWSFCTHRGDDPEFNWLLASVSDQDEAILMGKLFIVTHGFGAFEEVWITKDSSLIGRWVLTKGARPLPKFVYEQKIEREPYWEHNLVRSLKIVKNAFPSE